MKVEIKPLKKDVLSFRNPKSNKITEVTIYYTLSKITVVTYDKLDFYYMNKLLRFLNKMERESTVDISKYLIQTLNL